jgi:hypothetical protein
MSVNETSARARVRKLERERDAVAKALREETAQVLGSAILHLAAVRDRYELGEGQSDLDGLRGDLRAEMLHVLEIAARLG